MRHTLFILVPALFCAGCAADKQAHEVALHAVKSTVAYESAVDEKVAAEKGFYRTQLATIRERLGGNNNITAPPPVAKGTEATEALANDTKTATRPAATSTPAADTEKIKKSLPYGRIITHAQRDARVLAEQISTGGGPLAMEALINYVDAGVTSEQEDVLALIERQRALATSLSAGLEPINQQKQKLEEIRAKLTALAAKPSASDDLKQALAFGKAIQAQLNAQKTQKK